MSIVSCIERSTAFMIVLHLSIVSCIERSTSFRLSFVADRRGLKPAFLMEYTENCSYTQ